MKFLKRKKKTTGISPINWTDEETDAWAEHIKREEAKKDEFAKMIAKVQEENMKALIRRAL